MVCVGRLESGEAAGQGSGGAVGRWERRGIGEAGQWGGVGAGERWGVGGEWLEGWGRGVDN